MIFFKHREINVPLKLDKNIFNNLTLENNNFFVKTIEQLILCLSNEDSSIFIYDDCANLKKDNIDFIYNYFDLNCENRKINQFLNKIILKSINEDALKTNELLTNGFQYILSKTSSIMSNISISIPEYANFLKIFNIKIEILGEKLLDKLINYVDALVEFAQIKNLILLSAKEYFSKDELIKLFVHCQYKEVSLLNIQFFNPYKIENEKNLIIDNDLCEIVEN